MQRAWPPQGGEAGFCLCPPCRALRPIQLPPHTASLGVDVAYNLSPTPTQGAPGLWMGSSWQPGPQVCRLSPMSYVRQHQGLPALTALPLDYPEPASHPISCSLPLLRDPRGFQDHQDPLECLDCR